MASNEELREVKEMLAEMRALTQNQKEEADRHATEADQRYATLEGRLQAHGNIAEQLARIAQGTRGDASTSTSNSVHVPDTSTTRFVSHEKGLALPTFGGDKTKTTVEQFCKRVDQFQADMQWSEEKTAAQAMLYLEGKPYEAMDILAKHSESGAKTWNGPHGLKAALLQTYGKTLTAYSLKKALTEFQQRQAEPVMLYHQRVLHMVDFFTDSLVQFIVDTEHVKPVNADKTRHEVEQLVKSDAYAIGCNKMMHFTSQVLRSTVIEAGLRDEEVRLAMSSTKKLNPAATIEQQLAVAKEKYDQVHRNFASCQPSATQSATVAAFAAEPGDDAEEDDTVEIAALNARITALQKKKKFGAQGGGGQRRPDAPGDRKPRTCHYCGRTNHFIKDCRDRIAGRPSLQQKQEGTKPPNKPTQQRKEKVAAVNADSDEYEDDDHNDGHVNIAMLSDLTRRLALAAEREQCKTSGN